MIKLAKHYRPTNERDKSAKDDFFQGLREQIIVSVVSECCNSFVSASPLCIFTAHSFAKRCYRRDSLTNGGRHYLVGLDYRVS